jgi:hypothetical protein
MDEYNSGMDPEVKRYFKQILRSFSAGLLWLMSMGIPGFFFKLAVVRGTLRWYNVFYYCLCAVSLVALIFYLSKVWRQKT